MPELLWVAPETGQMAAMLLEAAGHNVELVSVTHSEIETKPSTGGGGPHADVVVYSSWKTSGGKNRTLAARRVWQFSIGFGH